MIYKFIIIFFGIVILTLQDHNRNIIQKNKNEIIYATVLESLLIFAFLVSINVGRADITGYLQIFNDSPLFYEKELFSFARNQHTEIGYNYFQALVKSIYPSATLFFIIFCFVSLLLRYKFYISFISKRDIGIVLLAFFSHEFLRKDCVQIRNGFASAIVLYSLISLYKEKKLNFVITVLFASLFHSAAIVALPLVLLSTNFSKRYYHFLVILFITSCILSIVFPIKNILFLLEKMGILSSRVVNYLYWSDYSKSMKLTNPQILRQVFICLLFFHKKKYFIENKKIFFLFQVYLISTVYYLLFRDFEILAGRFGSLFYAAEAPLLVLLITQSRKKIFLKNFALCLFYFGVLLLNLKTYTALGWNPQWN